MPQASPPAVVAAVGAEHQRGLGQATSPPPPRGGGRILGSWTGPSNLQAPDSPVRRGAAVTQLRGRGAPCGCPTAPGPGFRARRRRRRNWQRRRRRRRTRSRPCVSSPLTWAREGRPSVLPLANWPKYQHGSSRGFQGWGGGHCCHRPML